MAVDVIEQRRFPVAGSFMGTSFDKFSQIRKSKSDSKILIAVAADVMQTVSMKRATMWLCIAAPAVFTACSPAKHMQALPVMENPKAYYGKKIEICGDLVMGEHRGFKDGKFYPGFFLFSASGQGSIMHGRVGLFLPRRAWLTEYVGLNVCVTGAISHYTGMTPAQLAQLPGQEVTDAAVDAQWHFDATAVRLAESR